MTYMVETRRIELPTSCLPDKRSPELSYVPTGYFRCIQLFLNGVYPAKRRFVK